MAEAQLIIKYDGGDAAHHTIEMRSLGLSLIGFERIVSDGLIFMSQNRLPRRRERHQLVVKAREPVIGSLEFPYDLLQSAALLPMGWWFLQTGAGEVVSHWLTFVFAKLSGRSSEMKDAMDAMVKIRELELSANAASEQRRLEHDAGWHDQLFTLTNRLANAAIQAVTPVGPSVSSLKFNGSAAPAFTIDLPTADAIRAKGELDMTALREMDLRLDGFVHHTKKLNVENPEIPGAFITADIRDPAFDNVPNAYTEAANVKGVMRVFAKLGYRAGILEKIYIMDHGGRVDNAA